MLRHFAALCILLALTGNAAIGQDEPNDSTSLGEKLQTFLGMNNPRVGVVAQFDADYLHTNGEWESRFYIANLRMFLSGIHDEKFSYLIQGSLNGGFTLYDLKFSYRMNDHWRFDAGQFKTPFGREYLRNVARILFIQRSNVACRIGPFRQQGVQVNSVWWDRKIQLTGGVFNGAGMNSTDRKISLYCGKLQLRSADPSSQEKELRAEIDGSIAYSDRDTTDLQSSAQYDRTDRLYGASARISLGDWSCEGEYDVATEGRRRVEEGMYADLAWRLRQDIEIAGRFDWFEYHLPGWPFDPALRVQRRYLGALNWYPSGPLKVQVNYIRDESNKSNAGMIQLQYAINYEQ